MENKLKICVLISSHSPSFFTKMTVKSLLKQVKNHELDIHIGFHSNLKDYTNDFSMFKELKSKCQFHAVDEIDWVLYDTYVYRYSLMHSKNLENLLKNIRYYDFDYVLILDNDVYIKDNLIDSLVKGEDLIFSYYRNTKEIIEVKDYYNQIINFAPKLTIWNLLFSKKVYDYIMEDPSIIYPKHLDGVFYDTFAYALKSIKDRDFNTKELLEEETENLVKHFYCSSFNYGITMNNANHEEPYNLYLKEFDNEKI